MKIGIISMYYKSENYGGNLQAYALTKIINGFGNEFDASQISYNYKPMKRSLVFRIKSRLHHLYYLCIRNPKIRKQTKIRSKKILEFNKNMISHDSVIYNRKNIFRASDKYDLFITGSDQVWNPRWYDVAYRLDFVSDMPKMSYAASVGVKALSDEQSAVFKKTLSDYFAVSVREENAVGLLQPVSPVKVEWTLDPTMLLSDEQWNEICTERKIKEKYLFCYFLGDDISQRRLAEQYASEYSLKLVTLPHVFGEFRRCDKNFGDYPLYDVSPADFISLIKHADYIFTDSFHASVFSLIYKKEFFVFHRDGQISMGSRVDSLTSLFGVQDHFCDTNKKKTLEYIKSLQPVDYSKNFPIFEAMKKSSLDFLKSNLHRAKEMLKQNEY